MRTLIQQQLELLDPLVLPASHVVQGSALGRQLTFPFCVHRFRDAPPTPGGRSTPVLEVWFYDEPGSYLVIDRLLRLARARLGTIADLSTPDRSEHIATVDWQGYSPDLPAEEFKGICRSSTFALVGRSG